MLVTYKKRCISKYSHWIRYRLCGETFWKLYSIHNRPLLCYSLMYDDDDRSVYLAWIWCHNTLCNRKRFIVPATCSLVELRGKLPAAKTCQPLFIQHATTLRPCYVMFVWYISVSLKMQQWYPITYYVELYVVRALLQYNPWMTFPAFPQKKGRPQGNSTLVHQS